MAAFRIFVTRSIDEVWARTEGQGVVVGIVRCLIAK